MNSQAGISDSLQRICESSSLKKNPNLDGVDDHIRIIGSLYVQGKEGEEVVDFLKDMALGRLGTLQWISKHTRVYS